MPHGGGQIGRVVKWRDGYHASSCPAAVESATLGERDVRFRTHRRAAFNGKSADMVAHLVHRDRDGKLAVVAVLLRKGRPNDLIDKLWKYLPKQKEKEVEVAGVEINAADLVPTNKAAYYTFTGSLTTAPCSEGVAWYVLKSPTSISTDEVARFARLSPMNARPTQPLNGREIRATQ